MTTDIRNKGNLLAEIESKIQLFGNNKISANEICNILEDLKESAINIQQKEAIAKCNVELANIFLENIKEFDTAKVLLKALKNLKQALVFYSSKSDYKTLSIIHNRMGWVYFYCKDHSQRLKHNLLGLQNAELDEEKTYLLPHINNIADTYLFLEDYSNALVYLNKAFSIDDENGVTRLKLARVKYYNNEFDKAKEHIAVATKQFEKRTDALRFFASSNTILGDIAFKEGNDDLALEHLSAALKIAKENNIIEKEIEIYNLLANLFEKKLNYKKANECLKEYFKLTKKLNADGLKVEIQQLEFENKIIEINKAYTDVETEKIRLQENNRNLKNFAHVASHDMKEPLRMISSFSQLLNRNLSENINAEEKEYLDYISEAAQRLNTLVVDILEYSKIRQLKSHKESINLNKLFYSIRQDFALRVEENSATIEVGELPVIYGVRSAIKRLFQNLISNAIKFVDKTALPNVKVSSYEKNGTNIISIKDNGIGISAENKDKIFEMFLRVNNKSDYEGSGIGLATCVHIVDMHQGKIWVESELGNGATFFVSFPQQINS